MALPQRREELISIRPTTFQDGQVELRPGLEPVYANHALARSSAGIIELDFVHVLPDVSVHPVRARIALAAQDALRLADMVCDMLASRLNEDLASHSAHHARRPRWDTSEPSVSAPSGVQYSRANLTMLACSPVDAVLDFACQVPNQFKVTVTTRVVLPLPCLSQLVHALGAALCQCKAENGQAASASDERLPGGLRGIATWGVSVPFAAN